MRLASLGVSPVTGFRETSLTEKIPNCMFNLASCADNYSARNMTAHLSRPDARSPRFAQGCPRGGIRYRAFGCPDRRGQHDNPQAGRGPACRDRQVRDADDQARVWRLDDPATCRMEGGTAAARDPARPAVRIYAWQELHGLGPDHRGDGSCCTRAMSRGSSRSCRATAISRAWRRGCGSPGKTVYGLGRRNTPEPFVEAPVTGSSISTS